MDRAAMRDFQESVFQFRCEAMRQMNGEIDVAHAMRILGHGPVRFHTQSLPGYFMPCAELPDKIPDTTRNSPDEQFDRTETGVLAAVSDRLIGHNSMFSTDDVIARTAMIRD